MSQEYPPASAPTTRLRRWWPVLVPVVWAAAACAVMRPDAIVARAEVPFALKWLLYDESDLAALALRGANAQTARLPGRPDEPNGGGIEPPEVLARRLDRPPPPLSERYFLEYPPATLPLFRLGYTIQGERFELPPAVADSQQFAVAFYVPRNDAERALWTRFHVAVQFYVFVMAAALVGLVVVLRRGYGPGLPDGPVWLAVLPGAVFFALNRYDVLPVLATAVSFACLGRRRLGWAGAALAAGVLLKVYPILFVPVVLRYLGPRDGLRWLAGFAGVLAAGFGLSVVVLDWEGAVGPYLLQLGRTWSKENWSLYGEVLPVWLAESSAARLGILSGAVAAAVVTRPADLKAVLWRCALVLIVFTVLAVFWSPQWILWFLPLAVPLATRRPVLGMVVVLDLVHYFSFPVLFWIVYSGLAEQGERELGDALGTLFVYVRAATWVSLAVVLLFDAVRAGERAAAAGFHRNQPALVAAFLRAARGQGRPRGLEWVSAEPAGEPMFVRDPKTGGRVALLPTVVTFRPIEGSELEDVPQAREPRTVTAMFAFDRGEWRTTGRAVFNLTPAQVIERGHFARSVEVPHDD